MISKSFWAFILLILTASANPQSITNEIDPIVLGIFPYVSTGKLVAHHSMLRRQLNRNLRNRLSLVTAKNIDTYFDNIKTYQYDLIFVPPHLALFAENTLGYQPLAMTTHTIKGVFLVNKDSPFQSLRDIKNTAVTMVPEKALLHQVAVEQLKRNGLIDNENVNIVSVKTHSNAIYDLLVHDTQVALTGIKMWHNLPTEQKQKLRQIAITNPTVGFVILSKPKFNQQLQSELQALLLSFKAPRNSHPYIFEGFKQYDKSAVDLMKIYSHVFE